MYLEEYFKTIDIRTDDDLFFKRQNKKKSKFRLCIRRRCKRVPIIRVLPYE